MKKKSTGILMVLLLSMIININYVKADNNIIEINGEQWDKNSACIYKNDENTVTIYYKGGKTILGNSNDEGVFVSSDKAKVIYKVIYNHIIENNVVINNQCPDFIYEYTGKEIFTNNVVDVYTAKKRGWLHEIVDLKNTSIYILESKINDMPDIDNTDDEKCDGIINSSLKALINKYLGYIHIIVPIMILALGVYDFFRAMIASKEDEMKKAQKRFIIRLVAGVLVFLAPTIVNFIISALNTGACPIE